MLDIILLLMLLTFSGIFSGSETALIALSISRAEGLVREGRRGAQALYRLKKDPSRMLTAILIGNNLVNIAASVMATVLATKLFGSAGPGIAVGVLTIVILVFGEITPKSLATRYSETISLMIAPFLLGFIRLIYPLVWIFGCFTNWVHQLTRAQGDPVVTQSELISMLEHGEKEGIIARREREIIERVFAFNNLRARDVMTPRDKIFALEGSLSIADALPQVLSGSVSRIPLFDEHRDNIHKMLYLRDLLDAVAHDRKLARLDAIAHEPLFVPQYQKINELFSELRRKKLHSAIVVDEYGTVRGIVTLEDLLEELVGEIYDESDAAPLLANPVSDNEMLVDGAAELRVVEDYFALDLPGKPTDTVSLWILNHTASIPRENETFQIDGLEVKINKATTRRIYRVTIRRENQVTPDGDEAESEPEP